MSFVYLGADVATKEQYAIKVLSAALSDDATAMARLKREAAVGMRLAHPNICHIIRLGETEDGLVYVVMPYLQGEILSDRTNRLGHIPLTEVIRLVRQMAEGLNFAHQLKIVHRDLKPENVMDRAAAGWRSDTPPSWTSASPKSAGPAESSRSSPRPASFLGRPSS